MDIISSNGKGFRSTHGINLFNQCIGQHDVKVLNMDNVISETISVSHGGPRWQSGNILASHL